MPNIEEVSQFYSHFLGEKVTREELANQGWQCMKDEWQFNLGAGFGPDDDEMPDCMKQDAIGDAKFVWDIPQEIVRSAYERFAPRDELFQQRPS